MNRSLFASSLLIASITSGVALAQDTPKNPPSNPSKSDPSRIDTQNRKYSGAMRNDAILASLLLVDNEAEIALAQLAKERATDKDVKEFAAKMIEDHTQFGTKLQACCAADALNDTGRANRDVPASTDAPNHPSTPSTTGNPADDAKRVGAQDRTSEKMLDSPADHIAMFKELGAKCLESSKRMLMEKNGADFDRCYMGMQVGMHQHVLDSLDVFQKYASPTLQEVLTTGSQTVKMHLTHAKEIASRFETSKAAAKPGEPKSN